MRLSYPAGYCFIIREEAVILTAYNDGYGTWDKHGTIGAGHTTAAGGPVVLQGMRWTLEQSLVEFGHDIMRVEADVTRVIKTPLTQAQFDALVSFHYNTGGLTAPACKLRDEINAGMLSGAGFMGWTRAGSDLNALRGRREREQSLFVAGNYGDVSGIPVYDTYPGRARKVAMPPLPGGLSPPAVEGADARVGKGGAVVLAPSEAPVPGPGPAVAPPMAQSTTLWATVSAFFVSGGGMILSYAQQIALPALALLIVGGLVGWVIYQRYQHKKLSGV